MTSYGLISACYSLPDNFLIPDMMEYIKIDKDFIRVFEDTDAGVLRVVSNGKTVVEFTPVSAAGNQSDVHYDLMTQFQKYIPARSTVMFIDISYLSEDPLMAKILYMGFTGAGHTLKFIRSSWIDSDNFRLIMKTAKQETEELIRDQITKTLEVLQARQTASEIDIRNTSLYQMCTESKKK